MSENANAVAVAEQTAVAPRRASVLASLAGKLDIDPHKLAAVLKKTAFATCRSDEEFMSMCLVANKYGLDPITKEIYAFPNNRTGAVIPVVGYDGWQKLANRDPNYDGVEFEFAPDGSWCECRIFRKDRSHPTAIREYLDECRMDTPPWKKYPRRMLRNKAFNQCARAAFSISGIYDPDEAAKIRECEGEREAMAAAVRTARMAPVPPPAEQCEARLEIPDDAIEADSAPCEAEAVEAEE